MAKSILFVCIVYTEHMEWVPIGNQATKVGFYLKELIEI